ncbi:uncharacterized protein LOC113502426 isoform X1 [Trichoplusia ni]|uniref:Uncharacterized protein LOC113502426 isoform X1 n=1 Tax=Trichoplusia ni TaxID=7111 RepID=A0A7E5WHE9_TRINI|nr:uncharacterized protein LOC113502426 isoform X1 [Trichoplusia ni]
MSSKHKSLTASGDNAADKSEAKMGDKKPHDREHKELKDKDNKDRSKAKHSMKDEPEPEPEEVPVAKTPSQIAREEAEVRALLRRQRFKRRWPEVTKVKIKTHPWQPPPPPQKPPPVVIERPELITRKWVPPYARKRRPRAKLPRIPAEEITKPLSEASKLKKIWHSFSQVDKNKMILQGHVGCNSKKYSATHCGAQTGCIAVACRAMLDEKTPADLVKFDVDDVIDAGDRYYKQCMICLKCYKGNPQLQLNQLLTSFFFHDTKYTVKMLETDKGLLAKHPDNIQEEPDLMSLMEKRIGTQYMMILSIAGTRHFLIWGHPPSAESASQAKTICYIFDPHMLNDQGQVDKLSGAGAFLRYAGITSFVVDFLSNYGDLDAAKKGTPKPPITLTNIEVVQKEPLIREPDYDLDLKALKVHCRSEWDSLNVNALIEKKRKRGMYPLGSLSAVSLATSRGTMRRKVRDFYQKSPKEPPPVLPVQPDKAPLNPTNEQIMTLRGEDFFLYCPRLDGHTYGRDDMIPLPKSETVLHSPVEIADQNYHSQYQQLDVEKWILRGTRHMASYRYQIFKTYTGIPCCVAALGMLRRFRARAWNEDTFDETLDVGYNLYRESLVDRGGPIRRLVLGELKDTFRIRDREYKHKERGIAVWGKLISSNPKVFDLCRGIETFFKESDSGILQIPGEYEVAIWNEGGRYYVYHPWPADRYGTRVGLQDGGKGCVMYFTRVSRLCEYFMDNVADMKRKPFSISDVTVTEQAAEMPEPVNKMKPVAPGRWVVRGSFHEADSRFPEEHRGRQATPVAITALAMTQVVDPNDWTSDDIDETLVRGDILYQNTMEHLEKMGISLDAHTPKILEEGDQEEEDEPSAGTLAAADVLNRFKVSEYDCIETDVMDSTYTGTLNPDTSGGAPTLKEVLRQFFKEHTHGVFTARGGSTAIWKHDNHFYMFDPHGCDENGLPSDEPRSAACLVRVKGKVEELANVLLSNLSAGSDDSFNLSPVAITATKLNAEIGAPETKLESKAFEWINKGTAAIMMGPRGENAAIGKAADKAGIKNRRAPDEQKEGQTKPKYRGPMNATANFMSLAQVQRSVNQSSEADDMAGRVIGLPAAAAFAAATEAVPPPHMHQDHMFNFLEAGAEYYLNHLKKTGRKDITPEDLTEKFEMGVNTFSIELGEAIKLPLRLPDEPAGEGEEGGGGKEGLGEMEEEEKEELKQMKDLLFKMWYDQTKPTTISLLLGDYHQLGVWMQAGGKVVAFDPAPTLAKGLLTSQRIKKGDELRLQRLKDEMTGEGAGEPGEEDDEEAGGEGEEKPEPEPENVPPESCPVLIVAASPGEFIDKLTRQGGLDPKQAIAPYKLYPVKVINELTSVLKDKKGGTAKERAEGDETEVPLGVGVEEELVPALDDAAVGKYFTRVNRTTASVRARLAQNENYFLDQPNRDNQDAANAVMGIVVEHIEPYTFWKPELLDAILKYGDRLYTMSIGNASAPPLLKPVEMVPEFHVTNFNIKLEIDGDVQGGDIKASESSSVNSLKKAINAFFNNNKYGVLCAKGYCVGIWKGADDKSFVMFEPHAVGPAGRTSPVGAAAAVLFSTVDDLANCFRSNVEGLMRPGNNRFSISAVKVFWEFSKTQGPVSPQGAVPDEGYEWKVLTAFVETARGRTILRGTRPPDLLKFTRDALLQSACAAIVSAAMSHVRRPHLWTRKTVDEVMAVACQLFAASLGSLGYEFRPGEDVLLPLQVLKRFVLGVNYVRYELQEVFTGKLEQKEPSEMTVRCALERFFESHTHGVLWSVPHAVGVWRVAGAPPYYMMEPHACGPTGLRVDAQDDGAACVLTFTSPKLMAYAYLQNIPISERPKHDFQLYAMSITVQPIKRLGGVQPPLVRAPPNVRLIPATSKVNVDGSKRRASEKDRKHPPGSATCLDAQRAAEKADKEQTKLKGQRNTSGWLVLNDGTQFMSAQHSIACRKFPYASRGHQALACSVMAVAMSRVDDVCRWCSSTLDQILESGDQLYQDSYLHFHPPSKILVMEQILRKFYTPGNCVCRVVVYKSRHNGKLDFDLVEQIGEFFREEKAGVFVAGNGEFAVALFRTPRGYYMFDPADRDRYGRAVAPPCIGHARACFSQYPNVQRLAEKLGPNIPPVMQTEGDIDINHEERIERRLSKGVLKPNESVERIKFQEPNSFWIYGMDVTSLRRLNQHER